MNAVATNAKPAVFPMLRDDIENFLRGGETPVFSVVKVNRDDRTGEVAATISRNGISIVATASATRLARMTRAEAASELALALTHQLRAIDRDEERAPVAARSGSQEWVLLYEVGGKAGRVTVSGVTLTEAISRSGLESRQVECGCLADYVTGLVWELQDYATERAHG